MRTRTPRFRRKQPEKDKKKKEEKATFFPADAAIEDEEEDEEGDGEESSRKSSDILGLFCLSDNLFGGVSIFLQQEIKKESCTTFPTSITHTLTHRPCSIPVGIRGVGSARAPNILSPDLGCDSPNLPQPFHPPALIVVILGHDVGRGHGA